MKGKTKKIPYLLFGAIKFNMSFCLLLSSFPFAAAAEQMFQLGSLNLPKLSVVKANFFMSK